MSQSTNVLFPLVLDILSHKPQLSETQSNLLKAISQKLRSKCIKVQDLKKELETTIDVGKGLGILTVQDEDIQMPFELKTYKDVGWIRSEVDEEAPGTSHGLESDSVIRRRSGIDKFRRRSRSRSTRRILRKRKRSLSKRRGATRRRRVSRKR